MLECKSGQRTSTATFEEGTSAAWLYDLLKPHVARVVVCNPRKTALLKHGNKNDRIDAGRLANLLRLHNLETVYHGQTGVRTLRELARSYLTIVKDLSRVKNRYRFIAMNGNVGQVRLVLVENLQELHLPAMRARLEKTARRAEKEDGQL